MILRRKLYAAITPPLQESPDTPLGNQDPVTSKDLTIEQMKLQRQLLQTQSMKQRMQATERTQRLRQFQMLQRTEQKKEEADKDNQIKLKRSEDATKQQVAQNTSLYKSKAKPSQPVPMK